MNDKKYLEFITNFNPDSKKNIEKLENLIRDYPYFLRPKLYYLKILKNKKSIKYDSELKKIAISVYDRSWLFDWINLPWQTKRFKDSSKQKSDSKKMNFLDWINYLDNDTYNKKNSKSIDEKFDLIESFINNPSKIQKDDISKNKGDMSIKFLVSENELMTETLAKIYFNQKKYIKAIEAYKILSLKYPEKNAFFADQIKKIKKLEKNK